MDRTFKSGWMDADMQKPEVIAQRLDLKPLDPEGNKRGVGKDVTKVWKGRLRELTPQQSRDLQPVANNALSRDGVRGPARVVAARARGAAAGLEVVGGVAHREVHLAAAGARDRALPLARLRLAPLELLTLVVPVRSNRRQPPVRERV